MGLNELLQLLNAWHGLGIPHSFRPLQQVTCE